MGFWFQTPQFIRPLGVHLLLTSLQFGLGPLARDASWSLLTRTMLREYNMRLTGTILTCLLLFVITTSASADRLTPETLWDLARIGDASVSPDGKTVAYLVKRYELAENSGTSSLLVQPLPESALLESLESDVRIAAFDSARVESKAEALLSDVKIGRAHV